MALTENEITAGATYTVRLDRSELSHKRFGDALKLVKGIGEREDHAATYNGAAKAWTVTLPHDSVRGLSDLQALVHAYDVTVELAGEAQAEPARSVQPRPHRPHGHLCDNCGERRAVTTATDMSGLSGEVCGVCARSGALSFA